MSESPIEEFIFFVFLDTDQCYVGLSVSGADKQTAEHERWSAVS